MSINSVNNRLSRPFAFLTVILQTLPWRFWLVVSLNYVTVNKCTAMLKGVLLVALNMDLEFTIQTL